MQNTGKEILGFILWIQPYIHFLLVGFPFKWGLFRFPAGPNGFISLAVEAVASFKVLHINQRNIPVKMFCYLRTQHCELCACQPCSSTFGTVFIGLIKKMEFVVVQWFIFIKGYVVFGDSECRYYLICFYLCV